MNDEDNDSPWLLSDLVIAAAVVGYLVLVFSGVIP
jgi:hypothetical protein